MSTKQFDTYPEQPDGEAAANAELSRLRRSMQTIRDAYWTENESYQERVTDLQNMAKSALAAANKEE